MPRQSAKDRADAKSKDDLLDEADDRGVEADDSMTKEDIQKAIDKAPAESSEEAPVAAETAPGAPRVAESPEPEEAAETNNPVEPTAKGGFALSEEDQEDTEYEESASTKEVRASNAWDATQVKTVTDQITKGTHKRTRAKDGKQFQVGRIWTN